MAKKWSVPPPAGGVAKGEKRLEAVMNMLCNATTLLTASMSSALGNAVGGAFAGMGEAMGAALGGEETAKKRGKKIRKEVAQNVSAMMRDLVTQTLGEVREKMGEAASALTPAQKKKLLKEIQQEGYEKALAAVQKADLGLPRLTETLSVDDLTRYLELKDPRLGELLRQVLSVPQPTVFAKPQGAAEADAPGGEETLPPPAKPAPDRITSLPATYLFPPDAQAAIEIQSDAPLRIAWSSTVSGDNNCQHCGIDFRDDMGNQAMMLNGDAECQPENGIIRGTLKNRESFPITVAIRAESLYTE